MSTSLLSAAPTDRALLAHALRQQLVRQGALELAALGASMEPTVPGGSVLRVQPLTCAPQVGELLAFIPATGATMICCHRAVATREDGAVLTQGDRHSAADGWTPSDQIVGVVPSFRLGGRRYELAGEAPRPSRYRIERQRLARACARVLERARTLSA